MSFPDIDEQIIQRAKLENAVYNVTEDNFNDVQELFNQFKGDTDLLQTLIVNASNTCVFKFKLLGLLFELTGKTKIKLPKLGTCFPRYLRAKEIIEDDAYHSFSSEMAVNEYEDPTGKETLEYFIKNDDLQGFVPFIAEHDIDVFQPYEIKINNFLFHSIREFACFCGSLNILKYVIVNNDEITNHDIERAVQSGSKEMIEYLSQNGHSFNNTINWAISFHHNDLAKWLYENFEQPKFNLTECISYMNTEMLIYFIEEKKFDINSTNNVNYRTCLHYSVEQQDILITKYLLAKGIDKEIRDFTNKTALDYAESEKIKDIVKNA